MKQRYNQGFTLLELMIVVTIIGILAAASSYIIGNYLKDKRSEQHVVALWSELSALRAKAIKDNCVYSVHIKNSGTQNGFIIERYGSTLDTLNPSMFPKFDATDADKYFSINPASSFNASALTVDGQDFTATTAVHGEWYDGKNGTNPDLIVTTYKYNGKNIVYEADGSTPKTDTINVDNEIIFQPNAIGAISSGAIYLKNTAVAKCGYAIVKSQNSGTIKLFKWDGSKWYEM